MTSTPEQLARQEIDRLLGAAGWHLCGVSDVNIHAAQGVATGRSFEVRPVILFPGWFVEPPPGGLVRVWVLNPKALPSFLEHAKTRLSAEDVTLASTHLAKYIRAGEAQGHD